MYTAIVSTSLSIATHLSNRLAADPGLGGFFGGGGTMVVSLNNPQEMLDANQEGVSIWLYRVMRDENRLNDPPVRLNAFQSRFPPLPLRLHYMFTPRVRPGLANSADLEQRILGKILQAFHDHPRFRGPDLLGDLSGTPLEFKVRLETISLEDIARVWTSLSRPYQLSVSYEASVVNVDSELVDRVPPVTIAEPVSGVIVESEVGA
jgi:hypothetical protein